MRLFLAVLLGEEIKDKLCSVIGQLKESSMQGDFTPRENLHITLVFLGEINKLSEIQHMMDEIAGEPFLLDIEKLGSFRRTGGDIFWAGIKDNSSLKQVQMELSRRLREKGFTLEDREFRAHLTLGRRVIMKPDFDTRAFTQTMPEMNMRVSRVSLMKSERRQGQMVYTEIYTKELTLGTEE